MSSHLISLLFLLALLRPLSAFSQIDPSRLQNRPSTSPPVLNLLTNLSPALPTTLPPVDILYSASSAITDFLATHRKTYKSDPDAETLLYTAPEQSLIFGRVSQTLLRRPSLHTGLISALRHSTSVRTNRFSYRDEFGVDGTAIEECAKPLYGDVVGSETMETNSLAYLESLLAYFILTTEAASKDSNGVDPVLNALLGHVDFISEERLATIVTGIETERELAE